MIKDAATPQNIALMIDDRVKIENRAGQGSVDHIEEFDLTAAIWILSSLDENPIMTYRGVVDRVGSTEEHVRRVVSRPRELFRTGVNG